MRLEHSDRLKREFVFGHGRTVLFAENIQGEMELSCTMGRDLREWMVEAEKHDSLVRVDREVHWNEEMGAISYCVNQKLGAPAILFESITDSPDGYRAIWNLFGSSTTRLALAMNEDPNTSMKELIHLGRGKFGTQIEPEFVDTGPIFENTDRDDEINLYDYPSPRTWPRDGGRYIGTACAVITRNPESGVINVGTYRGMLHSENEASIYAASGKDMRVHLRQRWDNGEPLEVAVVYGTLPELLLVSGSKYGEAVNEYAYAGGIRGSPIELVDGPVTGLPIPAHAEIVAEGYIHEDDLRPEGPFGEFTGYYGEAQEEVPVMTVEAVHHRDDPILTIAAEAPYPGGDNGVKSVAMRSSRIWNALDEMGVSNVRGVFTPPGAATGGGMSVISIEQEHAGHAAQAASVVSGASVSAYFQKIVVIVDEDIDPTDINQVLWALATRFHPAEDVQVIEDTWGYPLDPALPEDMRDHGGKIWLDATKNYKYYNKGEFPTRLSLRREVYTEVAEQWEDLDLGVPLPDLPTFDDGNSEPPEFITQR